MDAVRVIVTDPDPARPARDHRPPQITMGDVGVVHEVWRAGAGGKAAPLDEPWTLDPPRNGHVMRISVFAPGASEDAIWMHRTATTDYAIILAGELTLVLETGETLLRAGDIVVQQAAIHGWINRGAVPCRMAVILIDAGEMNARTGA